ncbi:MAG TPA: tetratricopeptide repeat protein [Gaiellaceae bacterium]|jgi:tetratricopeptide (TPR) repeat protein|nr:tetratricopeptide repeat protein [Gaiellaceae bacterium]
MDASALKETIPENARAALEPTPKGARLRRRVVAVGGFSLLVLGFFVAIGAGRLVLLLLAIAAAAGLAFVVGRTLRGRKGTVRQAASAMQSAANGAVRRPVASVRTRATDRRERSRERSRQRDRSQTASRLNARGVELRRQGDPEAAADAHRAALELAEDPSTEAMTLNNLALALAHAGDERAAIDHFDASVAILREIEDTHHEGQVLANLGFLHGRSGRQEQAVYCLESALDKLEPDSRAFRHVQEQLRRAS